MKSIGTVLSCPERKPHAGFEGGGSPLHEALAFAVAQDASLTTGALGDEAASAIDASRMELHKLQVLQQERHRKLSQMYRGSKSGLQDITAQH